MVTPYVYVKTHLGCHQQGDQFSDPIVQLASIKARTAPTRYDESLSKLVRVGDPLRNIAPCISCHGGVDQKLGAPWLEGLPKDYVVAQLNAFASGNRHNESEAQMRNMVRSITALEIDEVATFYAGKANSGKHR